MVLLQNFASNTLDYTASQASLPTNSPEVERYLSTETYGYKSESYWHQQHSGAPVSSNSMFRQRDLLLDVAWKEILHVMDEKDLIG
jgi:hypothetical protein